MHGSENLNIVNRIKIKSFWDAVRCEVQYDFEYLFRIVLLDKIKIVQLSRWFKGRNYTVIYLVGVDDNQTLLRLPEYLV